MINPAPHIEPYSLRVKAAAAHFGLASATLYGWVSNGRLLRGKHFLKVGGRVVIIRDAFIDFMKEEAGSNGDTDTE